MVGESPFFIVRKGECSLVEKVRNIEEAGGHLAIIINDNDDKVEGELFNDDSFGTDISIPAVLIQKSQGYKLINYYEQQKDNKDQLKNIRLEVKFEVNKNYNNVKYDIWYTSDQEDVYKFFKEFHEYHNTFNEKAILNIHSFTFPHFSYNEKTREPVNDCLGAGLYCVRSGKLGIKDSSVVVLENIRQKCVYEYAYYNLDIKKRELFWKYMENFYEKCINEEKFNEDCSDKILEKLKIDKKSIQKCVSDSFIGSSLEKDDKNARKLLKNTILEKDYELRNMYHVSKVPSITINNRLYLGTFRSEYIFESLCSSLMKKPEACNFEVYFDKNVKGFSFLSFLVIIGVVVFLNVLMFCVCKGFMRNNIQEKIEATNINQKIDTIVDSYLALRDTQPIDE